MDRRVKLTAIISLCVAAFICFWMFLPFVIGAILIIVGITLYKQYKPQTYIDSQGKAVLITGCDTGFGNLFARRLDELGYQVFATCLFPDKDGACSLKSECSERLHIVPLDVTSESDVTRAVEYVTNNLNGNKLWSVVNNAGLAVFAPAEWTPVSTFEKLMSVNVFGTIRITFAFLPLLRQSKGRLVNIASLAGRNGLSGLSAYATSKFASVGFSDVIRCELRSFGIKVITIEPALYKTSIADADIHSKTIETYWKALPENVKSDYGEGYFDKFMKIGHEFSGQASSKLHEGIDCMTEAVTATDPPSRYVPSMTMAMLHYLTSPMPYWLTDLLIGFMYR